ncbi:hypothetical protein ACWEOO_01830 [Kribbella sp. NPDC004138]
MRRLGALAVAVPCPTKRLPSRSELPKVAYQRITVTRLQAPNSALRAPRPGYAQVIFACSYEEWSWQYEYDVLTNYNPPGRHWAGDDRGDQLNPPANSDVGRAQCVRQGVLGEVHRAAPRRCAGQCLCALGLDDLKLRR